MTRLDGGRPQTCLEDLPVGAHFRLEPGLYICQCVWEREGQLESGYIACRRVSERSHRTGLCSEIRDGRLDIGPKASVEADHLAIALQELDGRPRATR